MNRLPLIRVTVCRAAQSTVERCRTREEHTHARP